MQIVINISRAIFDLLQSGRLQNGSIGARTILKAVSRGTPLPKGHKRLIEDKFEVGPVFDEEGNRVGYRYVTQEDLDSAPTVVEADDRE